ncbi:MAG: prepilin-type N-terminal cleavage/methylation domain-containing protein [Firmicutes bacterium]|nr:prepilin-type N-terminal cleavage/methylation domain-containing protein [Bacillota bacterium]
MNTKGFTLVELLAVVIILALLALLTSTAVTKLVSDAKNDLSNTQIKLIKEATEIWMADNLKQLPDNNQCGYLTLGDLKKYGLLDSKILDPKNNKNIDDDLIIKISATTSEYGKLIRNIEVNPENVDGCNHFLTLAQYITDLYNNSTTKINSLEVDGITYSLDTTNNLMDDRLGGTVSSGGNIRYYGANPNNYVDIGDRDSSGNVILWRIIGVFETKYATTDKPCDTDSDGDLHYDNCATDKLVKIIRADSIRDYVWDYTSSGSYTNNWSTATLNTMLNGAYYNSTTTSYYNRTKPTSVDFTSNGLSANAQSKVENVLWNLGGTSTYEIPYTNDWYVYERGTTRYTGNPIEWVGKIGLMYPSDYGYGADLGQCNKEPYNYDTTTSCKGTDWISINQWTITPISNYWSGVFAVGSPGNVSHCDASNPIEVRPVLYLKSDVSIVGTGTTSGGISYYVVE